MPLGCICSNFHPSEQDNDVRYPTGSLSSVCHSEMRDTLATFPTMLRPQERQSTPALGEECTNLVSCFPQCPNFSALLKLQMQTLSQHFWNPQPRSGHRFMAECAQHPQAGARLQKKAPPAGTGGEAPSLCSRGRLHRPLC